MAVGEKEVASVSRWNGGGETTEQRPNRRRGSLQKSAMHRRRGRTVWLRRRSERSEGFEGWKANGVEKCHFVTFFQSFVEKNNVNCFRECFFFPIFANSTRIKARLHYHLFMDVTGNQCKNENEKQPTKPPKKHGMTTCGVPLVLSARSMPPTIITYVRKRRNSLVSHACDLSS